MTRDWKKNLKENLPFIVVALVAVLWHAILSLSVGDDMVYFKTLLDGRSIWQILVHRYQTWSSRLGIEFVLIPLVHATILWRVLDTLVFASIPVLFDRLLEADLGLRRWIAGFTLLYPFSDMMSAGWISTTTNYLWPLWCVLFLCLQLKKMADGQRLHWYEIAGGIAACAYAASQEQVAALLLMIFAMAVVYQCRRKHFRNPYLYVLLAIDIIWFAVIVLCPGNGVRRGQEIAGRMPEFADFSFGEKLYMGLVNTERIFIADLDHIFLMTSLILAGMVYLKTRDYKKTLGAGVPMLVLLGQAVIRTSHIRFANIFVVPEQTTSWNFRAPATYFPILFLILCAGGMLYALYQLMQTDMEQYIYTVLLLATGLATCVVMGFSPTIYASVNRPYIYFYFILIGVTLTQMKRMQPVLQREIYATLGKLAFTVLVVLALVNIADVTWLAYLIS